MNFSDSDERTTEEGTPAAGSREFMTKVVCECNGKGDDMRLRNIPRAEGVLQAHPIESKRKIIKKENGIRFLAMIIQFTLRLVWGKVSF